MNSSTSPCQIQPVGLGDELRSGRERGLFERGISKGLALPVSISYADVPMKNPDTGELELVQWPYLAPRNFASWLKICRNNNGLIGGPTL